MLNEVIAKYVDTSAINLNKLIDGSSVNRSTASNAIYNSRPRKTVKWIRFKSDIKFFPLPLIMMPEILKFTETHLFMKASKSMSIMNTSYYWHKS